jgi:hypothetical protein
VGAGVMVAGAVAVAVAKEEEVVVVVLHSAVVVPGMGMLDMAARSFSFFQK